MISKTLKSHRGNALVVALILAVLILLGGAAVVTQNVQQSRMAKRNFNEARSLITAHSFAALLKQDLLTNYNSYLNSAAWAPCRKAGAVSMDSYIHLLNAPSDTTYVQDGSNCPNVVFTFEYFSTLGGAPTSSIALAGLKTTPIQALQADQVNDFTFSATLSDFNLAVTRNSVSSPILLANALKSDAPINKNMRLVIDIKRTLASPSGEACTICRTVPGAVCCGSTISVAYLEAGSGRLMDLVYDQASSTILSQTPDPNWVGQENPADISMKNVTPTTRTEYTDASFCINSVQGTTAIRYIVDGAVDSSGNKYFLTVGGDIIKNDPPAISNDPKVISIAFDNAWYLLRSDGQVETAEDITDPNTFTPINGLVLPTAQALVNGAGPTDACTP